MKTLVPTNFGIGSNWCAMESKSQGNLEILRRYLLEQNFTINSKLPPERKLCTELAMTRSEIRKALDILESEGQIWRHVGRGTFMGSRPVENIEDVDFLSSQINPEKLMEARIHIEPEIAWLAARHAANADFKQMAEAIRKCKTAQEWRVYEAWDFKFHRAIALASHNKLLLSLFDTLNAVRRATVWGQLRKQTLPPADHTSFAEHDALYAAITKRDCDEAARCMRTHLQSVGSRMLGPLVYQL